jgi:Protein of unknown function (DUF2789)
MERSGRAKLLSTGLVTREKYIHFENFERVYMDHTHHRFSELFRQLGLAADVGSINDFLITHSPLEDHVALENAPFWNEAQASLLREELLRDADWAEVADQLNAALRRPNSKS